jgi:peptidoglycan/LPS O-acetylase OafA/YrhL
MSLFSITSLLPALLVTLIALVSARLMVRDTSANDSHEFASIDGLRGFLALFVFLHHSIYWFSYGQTGSWKFVSSDLYMNFGPASVSLFFMLTGFLFSLKLIDGRKREIDWLQLYCSRFMRLTPLYFSLCLGIFTIVAYNSHFVVYESTANLISEIIDWLLFVIPGHPDINAHTNTHLIPAGVIWTLPYEWYFYFMLPLMALIIGSKTKSTSGIWLILSVICLICFSYWQLDVNLLYSFVGGAIAALVVRTDWLRSHLTGRGTDVAALACFVAGYTCFGENINYARLIILTTAFTLLACGANLFGILTTRSARALSTISYGVYLLHGITLYVAIIYVMPQEYRSNVTIQNYWIFIFLLTPVLIGLASLSWHFVEFPAIKSASKLARWIRSIRKIKQEQVIAPKEKYTPFRVSNKNKKNVYAKNFTAGNRHD